MQPRSARLCTAAATQSLAAPVTMLDNIYSKRCRSLTGGVMLEAKQRTLYVHVCHLFSCTLSGASGIGARTRYQTQSAAVPRRD